MVDHVLVEGGNLCPAGGVAGGCVETALAAGVHGGPILAKFGL